MPSNTDKQTLTVTVINRDRNKTLSPFDIPKNEKSQDAANRAATQMGFAAGPNYRLVFGTTTLEPNRPVGSYHEIQDGATLYLVDLGGGV